MTYVEWLRVRTTLVCTAIVLGVLVAIAVAARIVIAVYAPNANSGSSGDVGDFAVTGLVVAMIVATVLGAPFARENEGHLEIALTKPIGRTALAVQTMLLDCGGVVASFIAGGVFAMLLHAIFGPLEPALTARDAFAVGIGLLGPIAWYAMLNAITASLRRGYGLGLGFAWPTAGAVILLANYLRNEGIGGLLRPIFVALSYLDPFKYMNVVTASSFELLMLVVLALVYGALAAFQWQRVEA